MAKRNHLIICLLLALQATPLWAIERNVSGQKLTVQAFDSATGRPKTGDAANITAYVSKDNGSLTALTDTSATEVSSTNAPGRYLFDLARSETNALKLDFSAKSSTSGVDVYGVPSVDYPTARTNVAAALPTVATTSLQAYWNFESNLLDRHGSNDSLTATNYPAFIPFIFGQGLELEASQQQHLSHVDNASLSTGDIDFSADLFVELESKSVQQFIVGKGTSATMEWILEYAQVQDRFRFYTRTIGGTFTVVDADNLGSPKVGVPYHIYVEHDASGNTLKIRVNGGTANSTATSGNAPPDTTEPFRIGYLGAGSNYLDAKIDELAFRKRVLTNQEQLDRYNSGRGLTYVEDAIYVTRPRSLEITQRKNDTHGDVHIVGTYQATDDEPTAIEARYVFTNPAATGAWTTIDANPADGEFDGTLKDVPIGSGDIEVRWVSDTGVSYTRSSVGVGRVFATAGQSNMQGLADNLQTFTNSGGQLCTMWREGEIAVKPLADSTNGEAAYGTPIPQFVDTLLAANPNCPVQVYIGADGGATIMLTTREWNVVNGASYLDLLSSIKLADPNAIEGVLWLQGEGEAYYDVTTKDYYAAQIGVFEALHALPGNPWVMVSQLGMLPTNEVGGALAIRQAQRNAWELPFVRRGMTWHNLLLSVDSLHARTDSEVEEEGTRFGEAILGDIPPVMSTVSTTAASGTVTIRYDRTLTTDASLATAAWSVPNHTVTAASCTGDVVTLTVTPVIASGELISVTHAAGNSSVGVDVPLSAGGMPAACETYYQGAGYVASDLAQVKTKTDYLPAATAGASGGVLVAGTNAATTFSTLTSTGAFSINGTNTVAQTGDSFTRIGSNGIGLTGLPWGSDWTEQVEGATADTLETFGVPTLAQMNARTMPTAEYATNAGVAAAVVAEQPPEEFFENAPSGGGGSTQPRINRKPDPGFTIQVSRRSDGTYKCTKPIRLTAGSISQVYVFIDMSPLFGAENFVQAVGTLSVSAGDIEEGDEKGPRDTYAVLELDGTADENCTLTVPVTMTSGTTVPVVFDVEILGE